MEKNTEDIYDLTDLFPLKYLKTFLSVYMPHSDLIFCANRILTQFQEEQTKDLQAMDEDDSVLCRHTASDPEIQWV